MKLVTVIGEPASGKSSLLNAFVQSMGGIGVADQAGMIKFHEFQESKVVVIGDYKFKLSRFPGTDKLSMQAPNHCVDLLSVMGRGPWADYSIVWEGDRLSGHKLLCDLSALYPMTVIKLSVPEEVIKQRHYLRGDRQSKKFILGRRTKSDNLMTNLPTSVERKEFVNSNRGDLVVAVENLRSIVGLKNE